MAGERESSIAGRVVRTRMIQRLPVAMPLGIVHPGSAIDPQNWFVIATLPLVLVTLMPQASIPIGPLAARLGLTLALSFLLHQLFARVRNRRLDSGWIMHAWLYALMLPAGLSLSLTALGLCFGVVVGALIFGGSGRYLVSPALLGYLFLSFGYPAAFGSPTSQPILTAQEGQIASDPLLMPFLIQPDALSPASVSAAACLLGAALLIFVGTISPRIVAGALIGAGATALVYAFGAPLPATAAALNWNGMLGVFPFCLAFIATDPTAASVTRPGRWCYGMLFGAFAVLLAASKPEQTESAYAACLLASIFAPLIDHVYLRWKIHRLRPDAFST